MSSFCVETGNNGDPGLERSLDVSEKPGQGVSEEAGLESVTFTKAQKT